LRENIIPGDGVHAMKSVTFKVHSLMLFKLEMVEYPELSSPKKWIQKGIDILKNHLPGVLKYLSRQKTLSHLKECRIIIKTEKDTKDKHLRSVFKVWVQKEKMKRLVFVIIEAVILPFTPILALLPGPNFFFYVPALLLYYHLHSYLGLRRVVVDELDIKIHHPGH
jgi:hypothetical protein